MRQRTAVRVVIMLSLILVLASASALRRPERRGRSLERSPTKAAIIAGATVDVLDVATNAWRSTTTGSRGEYAVPKLPPGGRARSPTICFSSEMLFGITPLDPKTFMAVSLMFGLVATFASHVPAHRAN